MIHMKNETIPPKPAEVVEVIGSVECDICHERYSGPGVDADAESAEWPSGSYQHIETGVFYKNGHRYPDDSYFNYEAFHVCPDCWVNKLKPWLESFGNKATESDRSY